MAATVALHFADGSVISAWESFSLKEEFTGPLNSFEFVARPPRDKLADYQTRLNKGELVSLLVNDVPQATCLIQTKQTVINKSGGVSIKLHCQSPLITPYEASVDPTLSFHSQTDTPLLSIILEALAPFGLSTIVSDEAADVNVKTGMGGKGKKAKIGTDALTARDMQAHDDERAYQFCSRIFSRYGVCLRADWNGKLLISAPDYDQDVSYNLVQDSDGKRSGDRFIEDITVTDSNADQYSEITVRGSASDDSGSTTASLPSATVKASEVNPDRPQYASTAAAYKPLKLRCSLHERSEVGDGPTRLQGLLDPRNR